MQKALSGLEALAVSTDSLQDQGIPCPISALYLSVNGDGNPYLTGVL